MKQPKAGYLVAAATCSIALLASACGDGSAAPSASGHPHTTKPGPTVASAVTRAPAVPATTASVAWQKDLGPTGPTLSRSDVPWGQVGHGWTLAIYDDTARQPLAPLGTEALLLVGPDGARYEIVTWARSVGVSLSLVGWSGDGRQALVEERSTAGTTRILEVSLRTGSVSSYAEAGYTIGYASATTHDQLEQVASGRDAGMQLVAASGAFVTRAASGIPVLFTPGPNGTYVEELAVSGGEQLALAGASGKPQPIRAPAGLYCLAVRVFDSGRLLASCSGPLGGSSRLWLLSFDGAVPTPLSPATPHFVGLAAAGGGQPELLDAWSAGGTVYYQVAGLTGGARIGRQGAGDTIDVLAPQGRAGSGVSDVVLATSGKRLEVESFAAGAPATRLAWYDPTSGRPTDLLGATSGGFAAIPFGQMDRR
ncbi:MAG TPA: hypothetical protein VGS21_09855 [Acidimicrobiales bacterium]|nr:hypothetical protein [Acidimicrobiales bacterium]